MEGSVLLFVLVAVGGFLGGLITSIAGFGGGLVLVGLLSAVLTPHTVVAFTAPVLMLGNVHRSWLFRQEIDRPALRWFLIGAVPAALTASLLLPQLPADGLRAAMGLFLLLFVAREAVHFNTERATHLPVYLMSVAGFSNGAISATIGGGGPLSAPFLHAYGLVRGSFVGTASAGGAVIHALKFLVFALTGLVAIGDLAASVVAFAGIGAGNATGRQLLRKVSDVLFRRLLLLMLILLGVRLIMAIGSDG